jgi:SEC-C motif
MNAQATAANPSVRVGRNDPCPCGSGRKYKHCCQAKAPAAFSPEASPASSAPLPRANLKAMYDAASAHAGAGRRTEAAPLFEALARREPNSAVNRRLFGAHDNIIGGAGYLRELHDRYPVPRFLAAYDGFCVRRGPPRTA